jgi:hypothetical protein
MRQFLTNKSAFSLLDVLLSFAGRILAEPPPYEQTIVTLTGMLAQCALVSIDGFDPRVRCVTENACRSVQF